MNKCIFVLLMMVVSLHVATVQAASGDLYVQLSLEHEGGPSGCSILRVAPGGELTEWASQQAITAVTGEANAECDDAALTVAGNGTVYFNEDVSDHLLKVSPTGEVSIFVPESAIRQAIGVGAEVHTAMTVGTDGNLYLSVRSCNCVIRVGVPDGQVTVFLDEAAIGTATGNVDAMGEPVAALEGGIARDSLGNLYLADAGAGSQPGFAENRDSIVKALFNGASYDVAVLADETQVAAATGNGIDVTGDACSDLDLAIALANDSDLYVADDGGCGEDAIVSVETASGIVSFIAGADDIRRITGNLPPAEDDGVDLEGGLAAAPDGALFVGDDGLHVAGDSVVHRANIVRIDPLTGPGLFVSNTALDTFYRARYPDIDDVRLRGSMALQPQRSAGVGLYDPATGVFHLKEQLADGPAEQTVTFGPQDVRTLPLAGDWNGNGIVTVGVYDTIAGSFQFAPQTNDGAEAVVYQPGHTEPGWLPVAGDWDGDGGDTVGLFDQDNGVFYLTNGFGDGAETRMVKLPVHGRSWLPVAGDWDGDAVDGIGLYNTHNGRFYLKDRWDVPGLGYQFQFGPLAGGLLPIAGDWDGDGTDTVGVYDKDTSVFYLTNHFTGGAPELSLQFEGGASGWLPVSGAW